MSHHTKIDKTPKLWHHTKTVTSHKTMTSHKNWHMTSHKNWYDTKNMTSHNNCKITQNWKLKYCSTVNLSKTKKSTSGKASHPPETEAWFFQRTHFFQSPDDCAEGANGSESSTPVRHVTGHLPHREEQPAGTAGRCQGWCRWPGQWCRCRRTWGCTRVACSHSGSPWTAHPAQHNQEYVSDKTDAGMQQGSLSLYLSPTHTHTCTHTHTPQPGICQQQDRYRDTTGFSVSISLSHTRTYMHTHTHTPQPGICQQQDRYRDTTGFSVSISLSHTRTYMHTHTHTHTTTRNMSATRQIQGCNWVLCLYLSLPHTHIHTHTHHNQEYVSNKTDVGALTQQGCLSVCLSDSCICS